MAELKYSKYFLNELKPEERAKGLGKSPMFTVLADTDIIGGCNFFSAMIMGDAATKIAGHGPHIHKDPEVLVALGTDTEHPRDLGAEMELCMGPEMEKHLITESTIIFIQSQYSPKLNEKSLKKLVSEEMRDKMIFIDTDTMKDF